MTTKLTKKEPSLNDLEEMLGSKERVLFYLTWLKHNRNATQAYLELHPDVSERSANVLGSRMLRNIDIGLIANAYNLNHERYLNMIDEGLEATKSVSAIITGKDADNKDMDFIEVPDHQTRLKYHDKLGKLIGVESDKQQTNVQVNVLNKLDTQKKDYNLDE
jgi:hypothetical protein